MNQTQKELEQVRRVKFEKQSGLHQYKNQIVEHKGKIVKLIEQKEKYLDLLRVIDEILVLKVEERIQTQLETKNLQESLIV